MSERLDDVIKAAQAAKLAEYAEGLITGMEIAVRLFLGDEPIDGAVPCPQPLTDEQERWARDALARLTEAKS